MVRHLSILVVEPNYLLREKIACVLARDKRVWCVTHVQGRDDLTRGVVNIRPDFILADLNVLNDPETVDFIRRSSQTSRIFALVDSHVQQYMTVARNLGLDGVIEKGRVVEELEEMMSESSDSSGECN